MKRLIINIMAAISCLPMTSQSTINLEEQVDLLYESMNMAERIAQLRGIYMSALFSPDGKIDEAKCRELIPYGIGHISQFAMDLGKSADEQRDMVAQLQRWLIENTPNHIPALVHEEALSGVNSLDATVYPQQIGMACTFNTQLAEKKARLSATELRSMGGALALSPMVDVVRNPSFNRLEESYGEDGYLSAAMGVAFVKGMQHGGNLHNGVAACTKHFLGYGGGGDATEKELMEDILLPHEAIIRLAGSQVVMTGYHTFHGIKCVANKSLQQDLLRGYLHFDGLLVSDYSSIPQVSESLTQAELCAAALNAGNEVDFPKGKTYAHIPEALDKGLINDSAIEKAVKRVLTLKARLGLLDGSAPLYSDEHIEFDSEEERATSYRLATQSIVLLKNGGNDMDAVLPLTEEKLSKLGGRIFLTGPNANSMWALAGDYSFQSMRYFWKKKEESPLHPKYVFLKKGMERRMPKGGKLLYSRGCDWTEEPETIMEKGGDPRVAEQKTINNRMVDSREPANWEEALRIARQCDIIVAAMGENVMLSGENRDRTKLSLPGRQEEYVNALIATGKPVVLVVFGGRAQVISNLADRCAAVIQAWYPGEEGGNAVADIIYGNVSPSGKLCVSYPAVELHEPICYNYSADVDPRIAWPFGYGLSYTSFEYGEIRMDKRAATTDESFSLEIDVENSGDYDADEVVQIYVSPADKDQHLKPVQLQGFARVSLKAGEKRTVKFKVFTEQLGYYANGGWNIAPGRYKIKAAASSQDVRSEQVIELTGEPQRKGLRDHYLSEAVVLK